MWSRKENYNCVLARVLLEKLSLPCIETRDAGEERNGSLPDSSPPVFFKNLFLNWRIIALQCRFGFCCTSTWISYKYTYVYKYMYKYTYISSLLSLPLPLPHPTLLHANVCTKLFQSCLTLCDPRDHSLPDSSVDGILHARVLELVAISSSRASSQPRDRISLSDIPGLAGWLLTTSAPWETLPPF